MRRKNSRSYMRNEGVNRMDKAEITTKALLYSLMRYCDEHPGDRFWQALRNWSGYDFIIAHEAGKSIDTFFLKGRRHETEVITPEIEGVKTQAPPSMFHMIQEKLEALAQSQKALTSELNRSILYRRCRKPRGENVSMRSLQTSNKSGRQGGKNRSRKTPA